MTERLDSRNIELSKLLLFFKQSLDLERIIGLNVDDILQSGCGKHFWAHVQRLALESCVINICKIYEREKNFELNSMHSILEFIKNNELRPNDITPIDMFLKDYRFLPEGKNSRIEELERARLSFCSKHKKSFERFIYARNKIITHSEVDAQLDLLPSHTVMQDILLFGIRFTQMITKAYLENVEPSLIQNNEYILSSAYRVLEKLGISHIKREFDK